MVGGPVLIIRDLVFRRDFIGGQMAGYDLFVDDDGSAYHIHAPKITDAAHLPAKRRFSFIERALYRIFPEDFMSSSIMKRNASTISSHRLLGWRRIRPVFPADSIWGLGPN